MGHVLNKLGLYREETMNAPYANVVGVSYDVCIDIDTDYDDDAVIEHGIFEVRDESDTDQASTTKIVGVSSYGSGQSPYCLFIQPTSDESVKITDISITASNVLDITTTNANYNVVAADLTSGAPATILGLANDLIAGNLSVTGWDVATTQDGATFDGFLTKNIGKMELININSSAGDISYKMYYCDVSEGFIRTGGKFIAMESATDYDAGILAAESCTTKYYSLEMATGDDHYSQHGTGTITAFNDTTNLSLIEQGYKYTSVAAREDTLDIPHDTETTYIDLINEVGGPFIPYDGDINADCYITAIILRLEDATDMQCKLYINGIAYVDTGNGISCEIPPVATVGSEEHLQFVLGMIRIPRNTSVGKPPDIELSLYQDSGAGLDCYRAYIMGWQIPEP